MGVSKYFTKINTTHLVMGFVVLGVGVYYVSKKADEVSEAINPVNDNNIINRGVSKVVTDLTDGKHKNLGSWLFCKFNPDAVTCRSPVLDIVEKV